VRDLEALEVLMAKSLRVLVVIDREDRHRGEHWGTVLDEVRARGLIDPVVTLWPLADRIRAPLSADRVFWEQLSETDVLVINWDAVNGDPDFGADIALRWFEVRWPAVRSWLNNGGLLILEGQALLGVPYERAYASVLGPREVRVSGVEDPRVPEAQAKRMRGDSQMTRAAKRVRGFENLDVLTPLPNLTFDDLFPPQTAGRLLAPSIRRLSFGDMLYRGWFRRRTSRSTLPWVPYARRAKRWPLNYSTLLGAKCAQKGIAFASTILLSATRQVALVEALLLTHGNVAALPDPAPFTRFLAKHLPKLAAGILSALLLALADPSAASRTFVAPAIGLAVTLLLEAVPVAARAGHKLVRTFTGA
jgi:hypothetical protein